MYSDYNNIVDLTGGYPDITGLCPDYLYYQEKEGETEMKKYWIAAVLCLYAMKEMRAEFPYYLYEIGDNKSVAENEFFSTFMHCYYNYSKSLIQEESNATKAFVLNASDGSGPFAVGEPQFGIYTGSSQKALAWEFIKFCIQEKEYDFNGGENAYYNYVETFGTPINCKDSAG